MGKSSKHNGPVVLVLAKRFQVNLSQWPCVVGCTFCRLRKTISYLSNGGELAYVQTPIRNHINNCMTCVHRKRTPICGHL